MTSTILSISKKLKELNYKNIIQLGSLLKSYSKSNEYDWISYIECSHFNPYTNYNKELFDFNNIECNLMNIPRGYGYCNMAKNNTSFLVLHGNIIKNNFKECNECKVNIKQDYIYYDKNSIGYIDNNEVLSLMNIENKNTYLLTLTIHSDILNKSLSFGKIKPILWRYGKIKDKW